MDDHTTSPESLPPLELRRLRYLVGIHEAGSLLEASTRLHVAQPAPGRQMAALEAEVGARL